VIDRGNFVTLLGAGAAVAATSRRFNLAEMQPVIALAARYNRIPATFPASEMIFKG
jgi:hypothetical protein